MKIVMDSIPSNSNLILKLSFKPTFDLNILRDFVDHPEKM